MARYSNGAISTMEWNGMECNVELGNLVVMLQLKELHICCSMWSPRFISMLIYTNGRKENKPHLFKKTSVFPSYTLIRVMHIFNHLKPELNPICHLLALLAHHFFHVSRIMVKSLTLRLLMSYIYIYIYIYIYMTLVA